MSQPADFLPTVQALVQCFQAFEAYSAAHIRVLALTPLLFALFPYAVVTFVAPGIGASWLAYFIYGASVRLPPLTPPCISSTSTRPPTPSSTRF